MSKDVKTIIGSILYTAYYFKAFVSNSCVWNNLDSTYYHDIFVNFT